MSVPPEPTTVEQVLIDVLCSDVRGRRDGDEVVLDTPHILQDGHLLQLYLSPAEDGGGDEVSPPFRVDPTRRDGAAAQPRGSGRDLGADVGIARGGASAWVAGRRYKAVG